MHVRCIPGNYSVRSFFGRLELKLLEYSFPEACKLATTTAPSQLAIVRTAYAPRTADKSIQTYLTWPSSASQPSPISNNKRTSRVTNYRTGVRCSITMISKNVGLQHAHPRYQNRVLTNREVSGEQSKDSSSRGKDRDGGPRPS